MSAFTLQVVETSLNMEVNGVTAVSSSNHTKVDEMHLSGHLSHSF